MDSSLQLESLGTADNTPDNDRRVQLLLALNNAAIAITGELELDNLLQRIVEAAIEVGRCRYAALGVLGTDGFIERFPTAGLSETEREQIGEPPRGHGLLGVMLRAGRTLRISDISTDPRRSGFPLHHPKMTSLLGAPIFVRGKLVGDLYLTDKMGGPEFTEEDEWLVQMLATHATTALTNAQLHAEMATALIATEQARAHTQALLRVTQAMNSSVNVQEVIELIVNSAIELLGAAGASLFLRENSDAAEGGPAGECLVEQQRVMASHAQHLIKEPLGGRLQRERKDNPVVQAYLSGHTQVDQSALHKALEGEPDNSALRSHVAVPLRAGGQALGVLSIYSVRPMRFDDEAIELAEAFGAQASAALHNTTLYEQALRGREAAEREGERLRELEQMKDEFLSTAAHELRTPLTSIRMSAGIAHEQMKMLVDSGQPGYDPRLIELIGLVLEGSERMHSLVNDLLDLTRLEQGRTTLNMEVLDMRDVVRASAAATMPLFESRRQWLSIQAPEQYFRVLGDRQRLEQILVNLLSNAHKYSPEGSSVQMRLARSGSECLVVLRDNGHGVPIEEHELIFKRFYRSTMHRQDRTASTGLGLPIARTIAELHKGRLWVENAPACGSIFTLALPLVEG